MRGKRKPTLATRFGVRITPAHAGKTKNLLILISRTADHPRACGENETIGRNATEGRGSPPRMRGKLFLDAEREELRRITPAHAGKTEAPQH